MGEACSNGGYCMFDNWYVVQIRTGKEEIVKKCQFYIDHGILLDCFIPITKRKRNIKEVGILSMIFFLRDISL